MKDIKNKRQNRTVCEDFNFIELFTYHMKLEHECN